MTDAKNTTPQQGQDAPEMMVRETIEPCIEYPTGGSFYHEIVRKTYRGKVNTYTRKDIADAEAAHAEQRFNEAAEVQDREIFKRDKRIAELEARLDNYIHSSNVMLIQTQDRVDTQLATARNGALEEAATDITVGYEEFDDCVVVDSLKDAYAISRHQSAREIRALKSEGEG